MDYTISAGTLKDSSVTLLRDEARGCRITYTPEFLLPGEADTLLAALLGAPFQAEAPVMFGRPVPVKRQSCAYGEPGLRYRYSGGVRVASPWTPELLPVVERIRARLGVYSNFVLVNLYPDGEAGLGWHTDNERDIVAGTPIASLSLGTVREFQVRLGTQGPAVLSTPLAHGSLLVMKGNTQTHYQHQVPRRLRVRAPRVNLTFRVLHR